VIIRFFSFFPSVIDHDESTYLEMSRMLLSGKILYVDMIDIKPPGIFLILAGFQAIFGQSIFLMRLLVAIWIGVTAFLVYKSGKLLFKDERASVAAGIIYIFFLSTWSFFGISITPEIFFNLFTITALYILLKIPSVWKYFLAGFVAGLGFIIKYFVILDLAVFILFFAFISNYLDNQKISPIRTITSLLLSGIGFLLPFALINLNYYQGDNWDAFVNIVYQAPRRYASPIHPVKMPKFLMDFQLKFFPVFICFYYSLLERKFRPENIRKIKWLFILWSLAALLGVVISGNHYGHYTIQIMLPISLMAGFFFHSQREVPGCFRWLYVRKSGMIILIFLTILVTALKLEYIFRHDTPREVAGYLKANLKEGEIVYTGNYHHIIYFLLKQESPTPYIHRTLLTDEGHLYALRIDQQKEFNKIISRMPVYILTQKEYPQNSMKDFMQEYYRVEREFGDKVKAWRRIE
jgi:4-amino-4-deoxy-L-arabinose transferase-like glycosyltransferase